eukprot:scaffold10373_cov118-Isochrysis_galbana.AAC.6
MSLAHSARPAVLWASSRARTADAPDAGATPPPPMPLPAAAAMEPLVVRPRRHLLTKCSPQLVAEVCVQVEAGGPAPRQSRVRGASTLPACCVSQGSVGSGASGASGRVGQRTGQVGRRGPRRREAGHDRARHCSCVRRAGRRQHWRRLGHRARSGRLCGECGDGTAAFHSSRCARGGRVRGRDRRDGAHESDQRRVQLAAVQVVVQREGSLRPNQASPVTARGSWRRKTGRDGICHARGRVRRRSTGRRVGQAVDWIPELVQLPPPLAKPPVELPLRDMRLARVRRAQMRWFVLVPAPPWDEPGVSVVRKRVPSVLNLFGPLRHLVRVRLLGVTG